MPRREKYSVSSLSADPVTKGRAWGLTAKTKYIFTAWREDKNRLKRIIIGHGDVFSHLIFSS